MARRDSRPHGGQATSHHNSAASGNDSVRTGGLWRLRNWRLRTKLMAVLLIPVVTLLALLGLRLRADVAQVGEFTASAARLTVAGELSDVIHRLQRERDRSVRFVAAGRGDGLGDVRGARDRVDLQAGEFARAFADARQELSEQAVAGFDRGGRLLEGLTGVRNAVARPDTAAAEVSDAYRELISGLLTIGDRAIAVTRDTTLTRYQLAATALATVQEQHSVIRGVLAAALARGTLTDERQHALLGARAKLRAARADFATFATPEQQRMYSETVSGPDVEARLSMLTGALATAGQPSWPSGVRLSDWHAAATGTIDRLAQVRDNLHAQLVDRAATLTSRARTALLVDLGLLFGVVLVGGLLAVLVARSLLRPMRTLRRSALDVAEHRLPAAVDGILTDPEPWPDPGQWRRKLEPVPVFSGEELGQIARAFDAVHGEAVRLAGEQAMLRENINSMFVNLSRRSQDLVERQLSVLDRMEEHEQDSETLGGLFELDHLATRMRRNSENLLVLSGQELDYPDGGSVTAEEVVGAALSEVEQYQRVRVKLSPEPSVPADVANDLVHVLSELLENATDYSPADSNVSLAGSVGDDGDWCLEITDLGAGMADVELRRVNQRLAEPPDVDVEVSRRMGLYVVARLSARHGISVRLSEAPTGGIAANVVVPAQLVTLVAAPEPDPAPESDTALIPQALQWPITEPVDRAQPVRIADEDADEGNDPAADSAADDAVGEAAPDWPAEDSDSHPLESEAPTERLPAYRDVLTEWFQVGIDGTLGDLTITAPRAAACAPGELEWPTSADSVWIEPHSDGASAEALPKRVPHPDNVPAAHDTPAMDEMSEGLAAEPALPDAVADAAMDAAEVTEELPVMDIGGPLADRVPISRIADEVRDRMAGLQSGLRQARRDRSP